MSIHSLVPSFNAGELSPLLDARVDSEKHPSGCRVLENFIPRIYGPIFRRPGMVFMGEAKHPDRQCRLVGFTFSVTTRFLIEMGHEYFRFWSNGVQVEDPGDPGNPLEVASPYQESELFHVQILQLNDVVFLAHPDHPPAKLSRLADDDWTFDVIAFNFPPLREQNTGPITLAASATTGTGIDLVASDDLFHADMVGSRWQLNHRRESAAVDITLGSSSGQTGELRVLGAWDLFTYGNWTGTVHIERLENGVWQSIRSWTGAADRNIVSSGEETNEAQLRIRWVSGGSGSSGPRARLEAVDSTLRGVVEITAVADAQNAVANVIRDLHSTNATAEWSEGAWSVHRGFPRSIAFFEQRIFYGGTRSDQQTVWASRIGEFEDMLLASQADAGLRFTLAAAESNPVQWLAPATDGLVIGTGAEEWLLQASGSEEGLAPNNIQVKLQSRYGSAHLQAIGVNEVVLFVQRSRERMREFVYSFERDGYVAPDLTLLAEHVPRSGIRQLAFQQQPDVVVWATTARGELIGMTYERAQNVVAWHRHPTGGEVESVATVYGDDGADEVWLVVRREIDGQVVRYIERFDAAVVNGAWDDPARLVYVDAAAVRDFGGSPSATVDGLEHLEGETVQVLGDGAVLPDAVVSGGEIELPAPVTVAVVGLPFTSMVQPSKREAQMNDGTAQGRKHRVNRLAVRMFASTGLEYTASPDDGLWDPLSTREPADDMDAALPLFTGEREVQLAGRHLRWTDFALRQRLPLPCNIIAVVVKHDVYGN